MSTGAKARLGIANFADAALRKGYKFYAKGHTRLYSFCCHPDLLRSHGHLRYAIEVIRVAHVYIVYRLIRVK